MAVLSNVTALSAPTSRSAEMDFGGLVAFVTLVLIAFLVVGGYYGYRCIIAIKRAFRRQWRKFRALGIQEDPTDPECNHTRSLSQHFQHPRSALPPRDSFMEIPAHVSLCDPENDTESCVAWRLPAAVLVPTITLSATATPRIAKELPRNSNITGSLSGILSPTKNLLPYASNVAEDRAIEEPCLPSASTILPRPKL